MTTIRIDEKILKQAKELGLNISKICENALKLYITKIQQINQEIAQNPSLGPLSSMVGRRPHAAKVAGSSPAGPTKIMVKISFSFSVLFFFSL